MLRVSKDFVVVGFPCGEAAKKIDKALSKCYSAFGRKVPLWLIEHLNIEYPTEYFLDNILKKMVTVFIPLKMKIFFFIFF